MKGKRIVAAILGLGAAGIGIWWWLSTRRQQTPQVTLPYEPGSTLVPLPAVVPVNTSSPSSSAGSSGSMSLLPSSSGSSGSSGSASKPSIPSKPSKPSKPSRPQHPDLSIPSVPSGGIVTPGMSLGYTPQYTYVEFDSSDPDPDPGLVYSGLPGPSDFVVGQGSLHLF